MTTVINFDDVTKTFGSIKALDHLSMSVTAGSSHGVLGLDGSGKSTLTRILLGFIRPTSGAVQLFGQNPFNYAARLHRRLAYLPDEVSLWPSLTGGEIIGLLARAHGSFSKSRLSELCERFAVDPSRKSRTYSDAERQKILLVATLSMEAELLVLDEPTKNLEPLAQQEFAHILKEFKDNGGTILLTSKVITEIENLCDEISILKAGRITDTGGSNQLRQLHRTHIQAVLATPDSVGLANIPGVHNRLLDGRVWQADIDPQATPAVLAELARLGATNLVSKAASLEEFFLHHTPTASQASSSNTDSALSLQLPETTVEAPAVSQASGTDLSSTISSSISPNITADSSLEDDDIPPAPARRGV